VQQPEERREEEIQKAKPAPSSPNPFLMDADFTPGAPERSSGWMGSGPSPSTSTPSNPDEGSTGAKRKWPFLDQDRSVSGVISPVRGENIDQSYPAGTFLSWRTPVPRPTTHDEVLKIILDGIQENERKERAEAERRRKEKEKEKNKNKENKREEDDSEDDNHKDAGRQENILAISGPSLFEQTSEGAAAMPSNSKGVNVVKVESEIEPFVLHEDEDITQGEPQARASKRKQANPKKFAKK
jgi:hypothetical protein